MLNFNVSKQLLRAGAGQAIGSVRSRTAAAATTSRPATSVYFRQISVTPTLQNYYDGRAASEAQQHNKTADRKGKFTAFDGTAQQAKDEFKFAAGTLADGVPKSVKDATSNIPGAVKNATRRAADQASNIPGAVKDATRRAAEQVSNAANRAQAGAQQAANRFQGEANKAADQAKGWAQSAKGEANKAADQAKGWAQSAKGEANKAADQAKGWAQSAKGEVKAKANEAKQFGSQSADQLRSAAQNAKNQAGSASEPSSRLGSSLNELVDEVEDKITSFQSPPKQRPSSPLSSQAVRTAQARQEENLNDLVDEIEDKVRNLDHVKSALKNSQTGQQSASRQ